LQHDAEAGAALLDQIDGDADAYVLEQTKKKWAWVVEARERGEDLTVAGDADGGRAFLQNEENFGGAGKHRLPISLSRNQREKGWKKMPTKPTYAVHRRR
jgi:hypothetical protein